MAVADGAGTSDPVVNDGAGSARYPTIAYEFEVDGVPLAELDVRSLDREQALELWRDVQGVGGLELFALVGALPPAARGPVVERSEYEFVRDVDPHRFFVVEGDREEGRYVDVTSHVPERLVDMRRLSLDVLENPAVRESRIAALSEVLSSTRPAWAITGDAAVEEAFGSRLVVYGDGGDVVALSSMSVLGWP